ncbi:Tim44 domain-containing protein [Flexibacterium corallicola]|uniref:Tim44 domain-containing protein n=1 Tax=Flexibacterium corallicola TaxID=3037259 RepID=UPI00286F36BA|nr:Tim44 domain-containing protein [Pseudovibrio sp. M1P-2-3]
MKKLSALRRIVPMFIVAIALVFVTAELAEAKRGMSFGSRGSKTFSAPKATNTAPNTSAPVQRSMTPNTQTNKANPAGAAAAAPQKKGLFGGGFLGSMLGGLALGGLIGMLFGSGFGGMAGLFGMLVQGLLIGGAIMLLMRFLRSRQQTQAAGVHAGGHAPQQSAPFNFSNAGDAPSGPDSGRGFSMPNVGGGTHESSSASVQEEPVFASAADDQIGITGEDFDHFEAMLAKVWKAYASEDYSAIRELTTPEIMGFFAEELGQAASKGLVNEVRDVKLLQGDLSESWHENGSDYATLAMRYSSIDAMRERATNKVVEGNAEVAEERTELWTFIRSGNEQWKLSAIQQG